MNTIGNSLNHNTWAAQSDLKGRKAKANLANDTKLAHEPKPEDGRKSGPAINNTDGVQRPEVDGDKKGRVLLEVSLRDPWPPDDPLRAECDQFLKIFEATYHETLAEKGLTPKSGDYTALVMSKKDLDDISQRMVEKLKANPEARELMAVLNVNFTDERPKRGEAGADTFGEVSRLVLEMWRKKHQSAAQTGENDSSIIQKELYTPKKQTARNIELLDFWRNANSKDRPADQYQPTLV